MADNTREYYTNSDARGGKPLSHNEHVGSLKKIDAKTMHLVQGTGGKVKGVGDQGPRESTKKMGNTMPKVKKISGGSNYGKK